MILVDERASVSSHEALVAWEAWDGERMSTRETWGDYQRFFDNWYEKKTRGSEPEVFTVARSIDASYGRNIWLSVGAKTLGKQLEAANNGNIFGVNCQCATTLLMCHAVKNNLPFWGRIKPNTRHPRLYVEDGREADSRWVGVDFPWEGVKIGRYTRDEIELKRSEAVNKGWAVFDDPVVGMRIMDYLSIMSHVLDGRGLSHDQQGEILSGLRSEFVTELGSSLINWGEYFDKQRLSTEAQVTESRNLRMILVWQSVIGRLKARLAHSSGS